VVVIEHAVQHEYPLKQQLLPLALAEYGGLFVVSHASTLRHGSPQLLPMLPWADLPTAARSAGPRQGGQPAHGSGQPLRGATSQTRLLIRIQHSELVGPLR